MPRPPELRCDGVIVLGGQQNAVGVVHSLALLEPEFPLVVADRRRTVPARFSRYVERTVAVPAAFDDGFLAAINALADSFDDRGGRVVVIPTRDEEMIDLAAKKEELHERVELMFPNSAEALDGCLNKQSSYDLAESVGVPYPTTRSSLESYLDSGLPFPAIIKPNLRRSDEALQHDVFRIAYCEDAQSASEPAETLERGGIPYVMQRFIPGEDSELYTAAASCVDGQTVAIFTGRKLRQHPPQTGIAAYAETVNEPRIAEYAERLLKASRFTGIAQVEYKQHDGEYYLMEINPRPWAWNSLAATAGVNLFGAWFEQRGYGGLTYPESYQQSQNRLTWMHAGMDLYYNVVQSRTVPVASYLSQAASADERAFWQTRDPGPGIVRGASMAISLAKQALRR